MKLLSAPRNKQVRSILFGAVTGMMMTALSLTSAPGQTIRYVDASRATSGNGTAWNTAYKTLTEALTAANANTAITGIHVAKGTYYPTGSQSATDRDASFTITRGGLSIYGGYPSGGGERDYALNPTLLSGDIGKIGVTTDNSCHVMVIAGIANGAAVALDGLRISWGRATGNNTKAYNGENIPRDAGGGLVIWNNQIPVSVRNCILSANYAEDAGAGLYVRANSPTFIDCLFSGNYANYGGGAINAAGSATKYINCTFSGNYDNHNGGAMRNSSSNPVVTNTIIHGNNGGIANNSSIPVITYSLVQGNTVTTNGNLNGNTTNPQFTTPVGPSSAPTTEGDYRVAAASPAINTGSNSSYTSAGGNLVNGLDLDGSLRVQNQGTGGIIDMGAYEKVLAAPDAKGILYVKKGAKGNGSSWGNALGELADALAVARGSVAISQIWVAAGTYRPKYSPADNNFGGDAGRDNTFLLVEKVKVYGHFAGTESTVAQRNLANTANTTVLSGDFNGDDVVTVTDGTIRYVNNGENAYHVVVGINIADVVLDGFTIAGGRANNTNDITVNGRSLHRNNGAGLSALRVKNLTISHCTIRDSHASNFGGGAYLYRSDGFSISSSVVTQNKADYGGGIAARTIAGEFHSIAIHTITAAGNNAVKQGGGIYAKSGKVTISNTVVSGNHAFDSHGGGVYAYSDSYSDEDNGVLLTMLNCRVTGNRSGDEGGGLRLAAYYKDEGNYATQYGANANLYNCTIAGNRAASGGAIYRHSGYARLALQNCIVWGNNSGLSGGTTNTQVVFSTVQDGYAGMANNSADPLFSDTPTYNAAPFSSGDYTLQSCSPAVNSGTTPDTGLPTTDLAGKPRSNGVIDRGAYEYQGNPGSGGTTRYVKAGSGGNGTSWADASGDLQAMINSSACGGRIFVAAGTYRPGRKANDIGVITPGNRDNAFVLKNGVALYGGFRGTETSPAQRELTNPAYATILSGDFNGNDQVTVNSSGIVTYLNNGENAYHVVVVSNVSDALLDGFTITGGRANNTNAITINSKTLHRNNGAGIICESAVFTLANCTVQNSHASNLGGGLYSSQSTVMLQSSVITQNRADYGGGATLADGISSMAGCVFSRNDAVQDGGGIYPSNERLTLTKSEIYSNRAQQGGGLYNRSRAVTVISLCRVAGNLATAGGGGGLYNTSDSDIKVVNCLVSGNRSSNPGGGIRNNNTATIVNTTLAGNHAGEGAGGIQRDYGKTQLISNCIIYGNKSGIGGGSTVSNSIVQSGATGPSVYTEDPGFVNAPLHTTAPFTGGDYRVQACWPVVNNGDTTGFSQLLPLTDFAGKPRISGPVDLGIYESETTPGRVIFVKPAGTGDGTSWVQAYGDLQQAINTSCVGDSIFVAAGTYKPNRRADASDIIAVNHRDNAFLLRNHAKLYGGFAGTETSLSQRIANSTSILSGDFNGDDSVSGAGNSLSFSGNAENAYHVVLAVNAAHIVLDGFTIEGGNAGGSGTLAVNGVAIARDNAGGVYVESAENILIANCTIRYNRAANRGGGLSGYASSYRIENSAITHNQGNDGGGIGIRTSKTGILNTIVAHNRVRADGGGMYISGGTSDITLTETMLEFNSAGEDGGGMRVSEATVRWDGGGINNNRAEDGAGGGVFNTGDAHLYITDATISNNFAEDNGGGVWNGGNSTVVGSITSIETAAQLYLTRVLVSGNQSNDKGGGIYNFEPTGSVTCVLNHVRIVDNLARMGGGIANSGVSTGQSIKAACHVYNSVISRNVATHNGGGIYTEKSNQALLVNVTVTANQAATGGAIYNASDDCIGHRPGTCAIDASRAVVRNSILWGNTASSKAGIYEGAGSSYASILEYSLVQGYTSTANGNLNGNTANPHFTDSADGDYTLAPGSPCINVGNSSLLAGAGLLADRTDLSGNPRILNGIIDMGPYEYQEGGAAAAGVLYVRKGAAGDGSSWASAMGELSDALVLAKSNAAVTQIWVSAGTYMPKYSPADNNFGANAGRNNAFLLVNYVKVYGGFTGAETSPAQRNGIAGATILSGDLDCSGTLTNQDAFHVVVSVGNDNTALLDGFTITGGNANGGGDIRVNEQLIYQNRGGGMGNRNTSPVLTNLTFEGNSAVRGGGMHNLDNASPVIRNSIFSGNRATENGGAMCNNASGPVVINCTFSGNSATVTGGGMFNGSVSAPLISNTIIYGNSNGIINDQSAIVLRHSLVQEYRDTENGNINGSYAPMFTHSPSYTTAPFTGGNYRVASGSPAINSGSNAAYADAGGDLENDWDMAGNLRVYQYFSDGTIDLGAFEFNDSHPDTGGILYVKKGGTGNGSSWADPLGELADAFVAARYNRAVTQIWVAKGIYKPLYGAEGGKFGREAGRNNTFFMNGNLNVYGGFAGTENVLSERNRAANPTILSGDLDNSGTLTDNDAYHVMVTLGNEAAVIDGFTITGGNANGEGTITIDGELFYQGYGGGLYNVRSSPTLTHSTFSGNNGTQGGGMYNAASSPILVNCIFSGNTADLGGGMFNARSSPLPANCIFSGNKALSFGGGMYNYLALPTLTNCTISGNDSPTGGGMYNVVSNPRVYNSIIYHNSSGIENNLSDLYMDYSLLQGLTSPNDGNTNTDPLFVNAPSYETAPFTGGDYTLRSASPVINAGSNEAYTYEAGNPENARDMADNPRIYDAAAGGIIDMGAFEFQVHPIRYVRVNGNGNGTSWSMASGDLQAMINAPGVEQVWVASGTYYSTGTGFVLRNNVAVYGGFPAGGTPQMADRNRNAHPAILSGNNARRVFYNNFSPASPLTFSAVLDGFTLIEGSTSSNGGAMYNANASPTLANLLFVGNSAAQNGGAIYNAAAAPFITHCRFTGNSADGNGGAVCNASASTPLLTNCLFSGNTAANGGALFANNNSSYRAVNVTVAGNTATSGGGAAYHAGSNTLPQLHNAILYGNGTQIRDVSAAVTTVTYSLVEGGYQGEGNLDADPLFVDRITENYNLQSASPAINRGSNQVYTDTDADLENDVDLSGNPRVFGKGIIDMGAFEQLCQPGLSESVVSVTQVLSPGTNYLTAGCIAIAHITTEDGRLTGSGLEATSRRASSPLISDQNARFVRRHYQLSAANNPAQAGAIVTLFFTKEDFEAYNNAYGTEAGFKLPVDPEDPTDNLKIVQYHGNGDETGQPGTYTSGRSVLLPSAVIWNSGLQFWEVTFSVSGFSGFFISGQSESALPVTLTDFSATLEEQLVLLTWQTTREISVSHFEVEYSADGKDWQQLAQVNAVGDSELLTTYQHSDDAPIGPIAYYRLKIQDKDASFTYSPMRSVRIANSPDQRLLLYPNPASERVYLKTRGEIAEVLIWDVSGHLLSRSSYRPGVGISLKAYGAGIVWVEVRFENGLVQKKRLVIAK